MNNIQFGLGLEKELCHITYNPKEGVEQLLGRIQASRRFIKCFHISSVEGIAESQVKGSIFSPAPLKAYLLNCDFEKDS
jgi:hypothetical protein